MTRNPLTFEATIDVTELTEREKDRQIIKRAGDKQKWDRPRVDSRGVKMAKSEHHWGSKFNGKPCMKCNRIQQGDCGRFS